MPETSQLPTAVLVQRAAAVCVDYKASDVLILDLQGVTEMTDFFVIASGASDTHVRALADRVQEDLRRDGVVAHHAEGLAQGRWVLLDYVDFVVHLFHPALRSFYQLERLWSDAAIVPMYPQGRMFPQGAGS
jgi:ribosome-associated protein